MMMMMPFRLPPDPDETNIGSKETMETSFIGYVYRAPWELEHFIRLRLGMNLRAFSGLLNHELEQYVLGCIQSLSMMLAQHLQ
jgi:hypothetical protein